MSASLFNISDRRFKRPNPERRAREERRFLADLAASSTPALAVRTVVATPEAQKRGKRRGKRQKRLSTKRREKNQRQAIAQAPPRDVIRRPSPPSTPGSAGYFKLPPLAPPKVPSWTSSIPALNEPPVEESAYRHRTFSPTIAKPLGRGYNYYCGRRIARKILATPTEGPTKGQTYTLPSQSWLFLGRVI